MDTSKNPRTMAAIASYKKVYHNEPGAFFLNAYAATEALLNAMNQAGSTDYAKVVHALHHEYVETPLGRISFDRHGEAIGVGFAMYQVQHGHYVELK
jgi:branched-chain amino acid transport system substrate-binding protein